MPPSRKKKTKPVEDDIPFARKKRKVGAPALPPSNATNTIFSTAGLKVATQTAVLGDSSVVVLPDLLSKTQHHALPARVAAWKTLRELLLQESTLEHLRNHLATILPAIGQGWLDAEDTVREQARAGMEDVLKAGSAATTALIPAYLSLLMAYTTSALNSLDPDVRRDGVRVVTLLATNVPQMFDRKKILSLLPSYVRLLKEGMGRPKRRKTAEKSKGKALSYLSAGKGSKNTRNDGARPPQSTQLASEPSAILVSLQALLSSNSDSACEASTHGINLPLGVASSNASQTAVLLPGPKARPPVKSLRNLADLAAFSASSSELPGQNVQVAQSTAHKADAIATREALDQLRYLLADWHGDGNNGGDCEDSLEVGAARNIVLIIDTVRHLWLMTSEADAVALLVPWIQLAANQWSRECSDATMTQQLAHGWCCLLLQMARWLRSEDKIKHKVYGILCEYCQDELDSMAPETRVSEYLARTDWFDVLESLLIESPGYSKHYAVLVKSFASVFAPNGVWSDFELAASPVGCRAALLLCKLASAVDCDLSALQSKYGHELGTRLLPVLASYLVLWKDNCTTNGVAVVLSTLHAFIRLCKPEQFGLDEVEATKASLAHLFESGEGDHLSSIFVLYPYVLQKMLIDIVILMGAPAQHTVELLACVAMSLPIGKASDDSHVGATISYIVDGTHSIRKQIPFPNYLSFLFDSTGVLSAEEADVASIDWAKVTERDLRLEQVTHCLLDCGHSKVLPAIRPLLLNLLLRESTLHEQQYAIRSRSGLVIVAVLSAVAAADQATVASSLPPEILDATVESAHYVLQASSAAKKADDDVGTRWKSPVASLCTSDRAFLPQLLFRIKAGLDEDHDRVRSKAALECVLEIVVDIVDSPPDVSFDEDLRQRAEDIQLFMKGSPLQVLGTRLMEEVERLCRH